MPELTEVTDTQPRNEEENDSGTDSDGDDGDSIPELEETGADGGEGSGAAGLGEDGVSKNKQSRGEKKARKIMSKLGLKQVSDVTYNNNNKLLISNINPKTVGRGH